MGLMGSIAGGDSTAFEELYDRYSNMLYALLLRILADTEDAREVLLETFGQVWNEADQFEATRFSEAAWLISITRSRGIDRLRSRRSQRESDARREISLQSSSVGTGGRPDSVERAERQSAVQGALSALPEPQRVALELAYFEGLSPSEIASRLQEPLEKVKAQMLLGMKKLHERLKEMR